MEISGGIQASLAGRYATALFDLARESKAIETVETSLAAFDEQLAEGSILLKMTTDRSLPKKQVAESLNWVTDYLKVDSLTAKFLGLLAYNNRLGQATNVIRAFRGLAASYRGETTAEVTSAHALTDKQLDALKVQLKARTGRDVAVHARVDPALLGGLTVKLGSQLIDSSLRTKLNTLAHAMKG